MNLCKVRINQYNYMFVLKEFEPKVLWVDVFMLSVAPNRCYGENGLIVGPNLDPLIF